VSRQGTIYSAPYRYLFRQPIHMDFPFVGIVQPHSVIQSNHIVVACWFPRQLFFFRNPRQLSDCWHSRQLARIWTGRTVSKEATNDERRTTNKEDTTSHFLSRPSPQIIFKDPLQSDLNIRNDRKETRETKPYVGTFWTFFRVLEGVIFNFVGG
jgi:hypothetical protein